MNRSQTCSRRYQNYPCFQGLTATQVGRVIAVAEGRNVTAGEKICVNGTPKDEMFLLTAGELAILNGEGMRVATINAVATVGELSVIAGQAHSATIAVAQPGTLLTIKKGIFQQMLDGEPELKSAILQNVIQILASRLMQENVRMRDHVADKSSRELQIKELQQKLTVVSGILADSGISGPDLETAIKQKLSGGSPRVLVVDDDPAICSLFKISLGSFEVMTAANGKEALEFLQSETRGPGHHRHKNARDGWLHAAHALAQLEARTACAGNLGLCRGRYGSGLRLHRLLAETILSRRDCQFGFKISRKLAPPG